MPDTRTGTRFPLELPIKLHSSDTPQDLRGVTGNVSATAVYMRANTELEAGASVEFELKLPPEVTGGDKPVVIQCRGRVVRTEQAGNSGERGVACVIDSYDFVREP